MATTNFNWTENTGANFEIEANTTFEEIDASLSDVLTVYVTSSNADTLSNAEFRQYAVFVIDEDTSDAANGAITITVPAIQRGIFTFVNNTAFNVTVTISGQSKTAPVLATNTSAILNTDGVDIMEPS